MIIEGFLTYLKTERRFSEHTINAYQTDLKQFAEYIRNTYEIENVQEVTFTMIRSYVVHLMQMGRKPKSVNRKLSSIKSFFGYLRKQGKVETNPALPIQTVKTPKVLVNTVGEDELHNLLTSSGYFEDSLEGWRSRAIIELLYATGMRRSELINIKLNAVDFTKHQIRVVGKRNKERIIPFPHEAEQPLRKYIDLQPRNSQSPDVLFLTDKGKMLYPKLVYNVVNRYLSYVTTVNKKSPHILRHSYATHLLNKGADVNDIKELLGHANLSATQVYTHNSIEKLKTEYNQAHPREQQNK